MKKNLLKIFTIVVVIFTLLGSNFSVFAAEEDQNTNEIEKTLICKKK